jgi:hypothetical protein
MSHYTWLPASFFASNSSPAFALLRLVLLPSEVSWPVGRRWVESMGSGVPSLGWRHSSTLHLLKDQELVA